ncbi:MAG: HAD family phosphatase [Planctomycetales bacterium]|nr:HAD family phosphatase [Planctomycetales bacterium]
MSNAPPPIIAVAFDLDGLMFNTEELYRDVGAELLRRRGKAITQDLLDRMTGRKSNVALQIMIDYHDLTDDSVECLERETDELFEGILEDRLQPMPGLLDLKSALESASIPFAVTTSSRRSFVERTLGLTGMSDHFHFWLTAEDVVHGKPAPEIYLKAAAQFGIGPAQMMVLEDSENGCRAAVAAGACVVAVPGEHSRKHDFSGAALIADSLADARIFQRLGL